MSLAYRYTEQVLPAEISKSSGGATLELATSPIERLELQHLISNEAGLRVRLLAKHQPTVSRPGLLDNAGKKTGFLITSGFSLSKVAPAKDTTPLSLLSFQPFGWPKESATLPEVVVKNVLFLFFSSNSPNKVRWGQSVRFAHPTSSS